MSNVSFFRVLIEPKANTEKWIARCIDTGFVTAGGGFDTARDQMLDMLRTEVTYARDTNNIKALFRTVPASLEKRWEELTRDNPPEAIPLFPESGTAVELAKATRAA